MTPKKIMSKCDDEKQLRTRIARALRERAKERTRHYIEGVITWDIRVDEIRLLADLIERGWPDP